MRMRIKSGAEDGELVDEGCGSITVHGDGVQTGMQMKQLVPSWAEMRIQLWASVAPSSSDLL